MSGMTNSKINMADESRQTETSAQPRRTYRKPVVTQYGSVSNLTRSTGTTTGDGGNLQP